MSLKAFHLVFMFASFLLSIVFGGWAVRQYSHGGGAGLMAAGIASFAVGAAMLVYSRWFLRKLAGVSYL